MASMYYVLPWVPQFEEERKEGRERVREGGRDCTSVWGRFCASCGIPETNPAAISSLRSG